MEIKQLLTKWWWVKEETKKQIKIPIPGTKWKWEHKTGKHQGMLKVAYKGDL